MKSDKGIKKYKNTSPGSVNGEKERQVHSKGIG